jgi:hypothetical protein
MSAGKTPSSVGEAIVTSRLLLLQSNRLLLSSTENCLVNAKQEELDGRAERLRGRTESAQHAYRAALLRWGSPETPDYWLVTYSKLIEMGSTLINKLSTTAASVTPADRVEVATDVEMLEDAVHHWRDEVRASMAATKA